MLFLLNADRAGADSVAHLIRQGKVTHLPCPSYPVFQAHMKDLIARPVEKDDCIVLDTLSVMAETTRGDMKLGSDQDEDIWSRRAVLSKEDSYGAVYTAANIAIMRYLRNANNRGYRIITICHEKEVVDKESYTKKIGPALNQKFYETLIGSCTDCMRLSINREVKADAEGNIIVPDGARILQTTMDDDAICKYQVEPLDNGDYPPVPKYIPNPTMQRIFKVLRKKPSWLALYGEPGVGKTTLACSEVFEPALKTQTKKEAT